VDVLDSEIRRSKRTNREFAMLFFELNGLKGINDRYGHMIGGQSLCRLADALCSCCRDIDMPARFGGDEFAVVLPETNAGAASLVARRICGSVANDGNRCLWQEGNGEAACCQIRTQKECEPRRISCRTEARKPTRREATET